MSGHWTPRDIPDLTGRTVVVTGANAGLGLEITRILAANGARVLMACRNPAKAEAAAADVLAAQPRGTVEVRPLDLANLASVDALADRIRAEEPTLHLLVNNAGLMAVDESHTEDGFEMQLGVNHLGHFALTAGLMPLLLATPGSRVVNMSSMGHRAGRMRFDDLNAERHPYRRWPAYFQSKLANLLFTYEAARRFAAAGKKTLVAAAHPGYAATNLQGVGAQMTGSKFGAWLMGFGNSIMAQSAEMGALPTLYAAGASDVKSGEYFGPDGFMQQSGYPKRVGSNAKSRDEKSAAELWARSEALTKVKFA